MKSSSFDIPIINVGNISAGGNGKTPQVEYLINLLNPQYKVAVLSRGYGRSSKGFLEVLADGSPREMGDEPLQIKRKFGDKVQVFVGENRVEAVTKIIFQNPEIQVIVLDDAFQHRAIKAGFNILLSDYNHLFTEDKLLPLGRLRENIKGANRAQAIVVTKCPTDIVKWYQKALSLSTDNLYIFICEEFSRILINYEKYEMERSFLKSIDKNIYKNSDSLLLDLAIISSKFSDLETLKYCLYDREYANIREGANPFESLFYEYKALEYAKNNNIEVSDELREKLINEIELPIEFDFTVLLK